MSCEPIAVFVAGCPWKRKACHFSFALRHHEVIVQFRIVLHSCKNWGGKSKHDFQLEFRFSAHDMPACTSLAAFACLSAAVLLEVGLSADCHHRSLARVRRSCRGETYPRMWQGAMTAVRRCVRMLCLLALLSGWRAGGGALVRASDAVGAKSFRYVCRRCLAPDICSLQFRSTDEEQRLGSLG